MDEKETPTAFGIRMIREDAVDKFVEKLTSEKLEYVLAEYFHDECSRLGTKRQMVRALLKLAVKKAKEVE